MTDIALSTFDKDIEFSRTTTGLVEALNQLGVRALDLSDLHRSALVQAVSALDSFISSEVQRVVIEIALGHRRADSKRIDLKCSPNDLNRLILADSIEGKELALKEIVSSSIQRRTFQKSGDISEALKWVGITDPWKKAFGDAATTIRNDLDVVVERRNSIVHDADRDPTYGSGIRLQLRGDDTINAIKTIKLVVHGLAALLKEAPIQHSIESDGDSVLEKMVYG